MDEHDGLPFIAMEYIDGETQDDKDIVAAYDLINANKLPEASTLAARVRRRNPKHPALAALTTTIETRIADEKKRSETIAAAAIAAEAEKARALAALKDPEPPAPKPTDPIAIVLPGGGFAAPSEPPSPLLLGQVERPAIEKVVQQWAAALGTRDVAKISNVRSFTSAEAKSWQNIYKNYNAVQMTVTLTGDLEVKDNQAVVPVEEIMILTQKNGIKITNQPRRLNYRMHKVGGEWRLLPP